VTCSHVTPDQIAAVTGFTEKHVRRVVSGMNGEGLYSDRDWFGIRLRLVETEAGQVVEFASLPDHIREAFVMLDQPELPLSP